MGGFKLKVSFVSAPGRNTQVNLLTKRNKLSVFPQTVFWKKTHSSQG